MSLSQLASRTIALLTVTVTVIVVFTLLEGIHSPVLIGSFTAAGCTFGLIVRDLTVGDDNNYHYHKTKSTGVIDAMLGAFYLSILGESCVLIFLLLADPVDLDYLLPLIGSPNETYLLDVFIMLFGFSFPLLAIPELRGKF